MEMLDLLCRNEAVITTLIILYFLLIPLMYNSMWNESDKDLYIKWYFQKSDSVNWLEYFMFFVLGLGSFIYLTIYYILEVIIYYLVKVLIYLISTPLIWLFEFLFLNKDCSNLVSEELEEKERERYRREYTKEWELLHKDMNEQMYEQIEKDLKW